MRILTYKRTHPGDPNQEGQFGVRDCMGRVRSWDFDAVIGVGGIGPEPHEHGIERRVNWAGLWPSWHPHPDCCGSIVTFSFFKLLEDKGPLLADLAPMLAQRLYVKGARTLLKSYSHEEKAEAEALLTNFFGLQTHAPSTPSGALALPLAPSTSPISKCRAIVCARKACRNRPTEGGLAKA